MLVEDQLFSTLETTVGRMEKSREFFWPIRLDLLITYQMPHWQHLNQLLLKR